LLNGQPVTEAGHKSLSSYQVKVKREVVTIVSGNLVSISAEQAQVYHTPTIAGAEDVLDLGPGCRTAKG